MSTATRSRSVSHLSVCMIQGHILETGSFLYDYIAISDVDLHVLSREMICAPSESRVSGSLLMKVWWIHWDWLDPLWSPPLTYSLVIPGLTVPPAASTGAASAIWSTLTEREADRLVALSTRGSNCGLLLQAAILVSVPELTLWQEELADGGPEDTI
jgi:hypothetical protein